MDSIIKQLQSAVKSVLLGLGAVAMVCIGYLGRTLKECAVALLALGWKGFLVVPGLLIAFCSLVNQTLPDPPRPRALLVCTTDGLPDLEVVCRTSRSANFHSGYIDFGDGSSPAEVKTAISPPVPARFLEQAWMHVKSIGQSIGQHIKEFAGTDASHKDDSDPAKDSLKERFVQDVHHYAYRRPGEYEIRLFLEGDDASDSMARVVALEKSDSLAGTPLLVENLELEFKDNNPIRRFKFRIMQMLRNNSVLLSTEHPSPQVLVTNGATKGWKLIECDFNLSPDLEYDKSYRGRRIDKVQIDKKGKITSKNGQGEKVVVDPNGKVHFSYHLSTSGWLWGRPFVQFDGALECIGELETSRNEELSLKSEETLRHGIMWFREEPRQTDDERTTRDESDHGPVTPFPLCDIEDLCDVKDSQDPAIEEWTFTHRHPRKGMSTEYHSTKGKPLEPIAIRCHGVEVSLAEWQPGNWPASAWLKVAPLSD